MASGGSAARAARPSSRAPPKAKRRAPFLIDWTTRLTPPASTSRPRAPSRAKSNSWPTPVVPRLQQRGARLPRSPTLRPPPRSAPPASQRLGPLRLGTERAARARTRQALRRPEQGGRLQPQSRRSTASRQRGRPHGVMQPIDPQPPAPSPTGEAVKAEHRVVTPDAGDIGPRPMIFAISSKRLVHPRPHRPMRHSARRNGPGSMSPPGRGRGGLSLSWRSSWANEILTGWTGRSWAASTRRRLRRLDTEPLKASALMLEMIERAWSEPSASGGTRSCESRGECPRVAGDEAEASHAVSHADPA